MFFEIILTSSNYFALFKVSHSKMCPGSESELSKEFAPHLWTEFTESIDVIGARKNRIESAQNISDVLEVSEYPHSTLIFHVYSPLEMKLFM